jgi:hypothetical protein
MKLRKSTLFLLLLLLPLALYAKPKTIRQQMEWLHQTRKINFVYDSSLKLDIPYLGPSIKGTSIHHALELIFKGTDIGYDVKGNYVLLKLKVSPEKVLPERHPVKQKRERKSYTLSGYVEDENGETLINATVLDISTGLATMTNSSGFFSITLPEGNRQIKCSYIGFDDLEESVDLKSDRHFKFILHENAKIKEVVVTGDLNSALMSTQTGKHSFSQHDIKTEFSLLSSPDVVKTLQRTSGVADGVELASGLYVHGGNNDENLFLIDGSPLYQVNHAMGLFSAFNVDMIKNIDFYKGGFPARYGGRLSSVVDVRTNDGDFYHFHGNYRLGLLDGGFHLEGPIRKGKTSFNIGLRRSWLDLLTRPFFMIYNHSNATDNDKISLNYFFHDLNAKVTNIFNDRTRLSLSFYSGMDKLDSKDKYMDDYDSGSSDKDISKNNYHWGNLNMVILLEHQFSPQLFANFSAIYTNNMAKFDSQEDDRFFNNQTQTSVSFYKHGYKSTINDYGYRMAFDYRPSPHHHIRFGHDFTWHVFSPQTRSQVSYSGNGNDVDTIKTFSRNRHIAQEYNFYAEDEMSLNTHWSLNEGLNASLFNVGDKTFADVDPRFAIKYQPTGNLSFKASLTSMTQFIHKISNSFLELPTDYWIPTTERLKPMHSWQATVGMYYVPNRYWLFSLEGYYKQSRHLLQYASWSGLEPPAERWDRMVMDGKGRYYGFELDACYKSDNLQLQGSYTLSWNQRKYADFYPDWYYDKFDNRHKVNLSARWKITSKIAAFADWSYHSGNHITVPSQWINTPGVPDGRPSDDQESEFVYERPNNFTLPAYHRLDLGFDFHHTTKHGHERIWNLSFYNVYCHLNSMYVEVKQNSKGQFYTRNHAYLPIIPSFSYTIKF